MSQVLPPPDRYDADTQVVIVGGGACGLVAALRLAEADVDTVILERDDRPTGSTAMSSGFVPAPGTRFQAQQGIDDTAELFATDIQKKAAHGADPAVVEAVTSKIGPTLEWLADNHSVEWYVLDDFLYPGHSRHRMHAVPGRTGAGLMQSLHNAIETAGVPLLTQAHVTALHLDKDRITGVTITRPDGAVETIGCQAAILACNGYGGNPDLVAELIPEIASAPYYGHVGNQGDAVLWGRAMGVELQDLTAYQGHGSFADGPGILITWALMMEGGFQVNNLGQRFSNEHQGYSEQAVHVLAQPGGVAWNIYDQRLHDLGKGFPDYVQAIEAGAVKSAPDVAALAQVIGVDADTLAGTVEAVQTYAAGQATDPFGRDFTNASGLEAPYFAIKVTGALFHTQGGLSVTSQARVLKQDHSPMPNLFAGGGAARGVSGSNVEGYLSGNGLLAAIGLGSIAGQSTADLITGK